MRESAWTLQIPTGYSGPALVEAGTPRTTQFTGSSGQNSREAAVCQSPIPGMHTTLSCGQVQLKAGCLS